MTAKEAFETRMKLQEQMAEIIRREAGAEVEVTNTDVNDWTISGQSENVDKAVAWLTSTGLIKIDDSVFDEELQEKFTYLTAQ